MQKHKWKRRIGWCMGIFLAGMLGSAPGATITWVGNVSSNWADTNNWSPTTAIPGTNDVAQFNNSVTNKCVFPTNTTQSVLVVQCTGFAAGGNDRKLVISPGSALHSTSNVTKRVLDSVAGDRGIIEIQSNAVFTASNGNYYISGSAGAHGAVDVIGGKFITGAVLGLGASSGTGEVHVSSGGYVKCATMYVGIGGNAITDVGWGVLTISNEASLGEIPTFTIGRYTAGSGTDASGRGTLTIYGGTLSVTTFKNAEAGAAQTVNTCYGDVAIRGGQLLVSGTLYNSTADKTVERGTITIASGATNIWVGGDYYQRTNCSLIAEITSTSHPSLKVDGVAYLAGTLRVSSNSVEQRGQWDIIIGDANTNLPTPGRIGTFNTFDASVTAHPANWSLSYTDDKVILSYSPRGTIFSAH